jgi:RNA polymerase sigma-70 factor (ECF subfamily)
MTHAAWTQAGSEEFPSTCWSQIRGDDAAAEKRALETLAHGYAKPIRAYLRALGRSREDARELSQDFFVWVVETRFLEKADPARGRFRGFLKLALRNYALDCDRRVNAARRGGGATAVSLSRDADDDEDELELADASARPPEEALDAAWRAEVVHAALERTRAELERDGKAQVFAVFRDYFLDESAELDYRAVAERHAITTVDVSNFLMRAKRLYRSHLRAVVQETVGTRADLDDELAWLVGREPA